MLDRLGGFTSAVCIICATFGCTIGLVMMVWILVAASFSYAVWAAMALSLSVAITLLSGLASILLCPSQAQRFQAPPPEGARETGRAPRMADMLLKAAPQADFRLK
jgi:multidrug efflux pump subunit AcrB